MTEALKSGIMIPIDTSKQLNFYADLEISVSPSLIIPSKVKSLRVFSVFSKKGEGEP